MTCGGAVRIPQKDASEELRRSYDVSKLFSKSVIFKFMGRVKYVIILLLYIIEMQIMRISKRISFRSIRMRRRQELKITTQSLC